MPDLDLDDAPGRRQHILGLDPGRRRAAVGANPSVIEGLSELEDALQVGEGVAEVDFRRLDGRG